MKYQMLVKEGFDVEKSWYHWTVEAANEEDAIVQFVEHCYAGQENEREVDIADISAGEDVCWHDDADNATRKCRVYDWAEYVFFIGLRYTDLLVCAANYEFEIKEV